MFSRIDIRFKVGNLLSLLYFGVRELFVEESELRTTAICLISAHMPCQQTYSKPRPLQNLTVMTVMHPSGSSALVLGHWCNINLSVPSDCE